MPNWCSNILTIKSTKEIIAELRNDLKVAEATKDENGFYTKGLLETLAPIPDYVEEDWYRLHNDYWGTKWDAPFTECYFVYNDEPSSSISVAFDSAWSPPTGACRALYERLVKRDPSVDIRCTFEEPGMNFIGYWANGDHEERTIDDLYKDLIEDDLDAIQFVAECGTCLETLAECYFCTQDDECRCVNCDPENPIKGYQQLGVEIEGESVEDEKVEEGDKE